MAEPALVVQDLHKTFRIPKQHVHTLKERALHPFRSRDITEYNVLRDINFQIDRGEFFGIVGRNGSGKSTLLKCMAGVYRPERGRIAYAGRLSPFIELGVGFNPDLTAFDNVVINGVMMGLTANEAKRRFDEIIEFAELEDFLDLKLKNYSSGMHVRLAFSVMVQSSADIFLIDEVLAVGDAAFQQKCLDVFYRLRDEGRTIILVTHDMGAVERFCHRAMFIQDGDIQKIGDPKDVARAYLSANFDHNSESITSSSDGESDVHSATTRARGEFQNSAGVRVSSLASGQRIRVRLELETDVDVRHPTLTLQLRDATKTVAIGTRLELYQRGRLGAGDRLEIIVDWEVTLGDGRYDLGIRLTQGSAEQEVVIDSRKAAELVIHSSNKVVGLVQPPTRISVTHAEPERAR